MLETILEKYKKLEAEMLLQKAQELLQLIDDEELFSIYQMNPELFAELSKLDDSIVNHPELMKQAIDVYIDYIENRGITQDEMEDMTDDELCDYITDLIDSREMAYLVIKLLQ